MICGFSPLVVKTKNMLGAFITYIHFYGHLWQVRLYKPDGVGPVDEQTLHQQTPPLCKKKYKKNDT